MRLDGCAGALPWDEPGLTTHQQRHPACPLPYLATPGPIPEVLRASTLGAVVAAGQPGTDEVAEEGARRAARRVALAGLTECQRLVLALRHGLDGHERHTLVEIGATLAISRERARHLEVAAIKHLRDGSPALRAYVA